MTTAETENRKMLRSWTFRRAMPTIPPVNRTNRQKTRTRAALLLGAAVFSAAALAVPSAQAAPAQSGTQTGHYTGFADASLLRVSGDLAGINLASLDLTRTTAAADSDATPRTAADARNTGTLSLLQNAVNLSDVLAKAHREAPPQNTPDTQTLIPIPAPPLLTAGVSNASAAANWAGDGLCVAANQPLSDAHNDVANATAVNPAGLTLIGLNNDLQGVSFTNSSVALPATGGPRDERKVVSQTLTHVEDLDVLTVAGAAPLTLLTVSTLNDYTATAEASGLAGGAKTNLDDPVVRVTIAGTGVIDLTAGQTATSAGNPTLTGLLGALAPLLNGIAPVLQLSVPVPVRTAATDGTSASISGELLTVRVLGALGVPLATIHLAPFNAAAAAPAGGIHCGNDNPIVVTKDGPVNVKPGESFTTAITVTNTGTCDLLNTKVVDQLTGPDGSKVTATDPQADSSTWPTVVWNNIGTVPAGGSRTLNVTIQVPIDIATGHYKDVATASGTCNGAPFQGTGTLDRPDVTQGLLPRTGGESTLPLFGGAALLLGALGLRRMRRI
jgi:hypothetical protein